MWPPPDRLQLVLHLAAGRELIPFGSRRCVAILLPTGTTPAIPPLRAISRFLSSSIAENPRRFFSVMALASSCASAGDHRCVNSNRERQRVFGHFTTRLGMLQRFLGLSLA